MYGKCVAANYQNVSKDMCVKEFMVLKNCYLVKYLNALLCVFVADYHEESSRQKGIESLLARSCDT